MPAQYVIGIDLGTTNCVLASAPLNGNAAEITLLDIPQLVAENTVESRAALPSFLYLTSQTEREQQLFAAPFRSDLDVAVGVVAAARSAEMPEQTISAAKSWLSHSGVDRTKPILPWQSSQTEMQMSPVEASQRLLQHLIDAWQQQHPDCNFTEQSVVLTVPASFDPVARELTAKAAAGAGFPADFVLLEEPQAAAYAWLLSAGDDWRKTLQPGEQILICDIGGGTTDLTLLEASDDDGDLTLNRVAVGNHLLVGGDNMDLALAHHCANLFAEQGVNLDPWQTVSLWHSCRSAKERLLGQDGPETCSIAVPGRSSRLIGGMVSVDVDRTAATQLLLEGFFPVVDAEATPVSNPRSGFRELGLPWEQDTGITRHLAAFLQASASTVRHVLFNGGVFRSEVLQQRLLEQLQKWTPETPPQPVQPQTDLDSAVARGACFYAWTRSNNGIRIRGGAPRSYYVGIETSGLAVPGMARPLKALCVVPHGMEEGTQIDVPSTGIGLIVGETTQFRFFSSAVRTQDTPGQILPRWSAEEISETNSLQAKLNAQEDSDDGWIPVEFRSVITELGVFELWCVCPNTDRSWKLEFSIREVDS
ncbi:MAG: Hsp70 family protein [Planctomycetaceae bacterium]